MTKITITIEQLPEGGCWITTDPPLQELVDLTEDPDKACAAHGYAWTALIAIQRESGLTMKQLAAASKSGKPGSH